MGALAMADRHAPGGHRYAIPAVLVAGWTCLFAYCAAYLTEDMPFRPPPAETALSTDTAIRDDALRRAAAITAFEPEATAPVQPDRAPAAPRAAEAAPETARIAVADLPPGVRPARAVPAADYVGVWGPTAAACGAPSRRRGYIPATITLDRARAGRTRCSFRDGRRTGKAWILNAACDDRGRRWSSQVRLVVEGDRLTWSSDRGTSAYVRCARRGG